MTGLALFIAVFLACAVEAVPVPDPAEQRLRREARLAAKN